MSSELSILKSLTVGASDDADIIIRQPTVSKMHCRFDWDGQHWTLTDLQSTNGTFVNGQRQTEPCKLSKTDSITLGRGVVCEIPKIPSMEGPAKPTFAETQEPLVRRGRATANIKTSRPSGSLQASSSGRQKQLVLVAGFALLFAGLLGTAFFWNGQRDAGSANESASPDATTKANPKEIANEPPSTSEESGKGNQLAKEEHPPLMARSSPAIFAVVVQSADGKVTKLLGTGVAIDAHRIATLASVIDAVEAVQDEYPRMVLVPTDDTNLSLSPVGTFKNPKYLSAMAEFAEFEKDLKAKLDAVDSLEEPSLDDRLKWSERFEALMESIASSDVAILEVKETLDTNSPNKQLDTITGSVRLVGFPLISPAPEIDSNLSTFRIELLGKLTSVDSQLSNALEIETTGVLALSTVTLACLTEKGQLMGLVVRQFSSETSNFKRFSRVIPINQILQLSQQ